ncbi:ABC transporter ATP-binding protein [Natroniella acetigena]|uniref:ABC transporter ATP-binding protein n=1 Tax=Natroniella acetigena TaxID=52004 RepID=UPI00200A4EF8|nr:ABC transporter ATP-binding protein [Natroniella acetigena]MCK8827286.1 ABC transporter ATP-binding protein [Natroniella acetigena]
MLKATDISYAYHKEKVITDVNFAVKEGEFVTLLGANGSGKTTILKCLNGILRPDEGEVYLDESRFDELSRKEIACHVSRVPQEHTTVFSYRTLDLVVMGVTPYLSFGSQPQKEDYQRGRDMLRRLGILHLANRSYNQLSGGERQLVLIARALVQDTDYLVMDEPTSHLDFKNQHLLMTEIKGLTQQGKGVVTALHDPNLALKFCDKVVLIKEGRVLDWGQTEEVMTSKNLESAYGIDMVVDNATKNIEVVLAEKVS